MTKNVPNLPTFDRFLTLFDFIKNFLSNMNVLACFDPIRIPYTKMNVKIYRIIFQTNSLNKLCADGQN